jgi:predicted phosphodiesterase
VLVVSDIHSNWEAWQAVWKAAQADAPDEVWCLGDLTGYGPDPDRCLDHVRNLPRLKMVMGNHDRVVAKVESPVGFNPHAIIAAYRNLARLKEDQTAWLAGLPGTLQPRPDILLCHGSPVDPDEYLLTPQVTEPSFQFMYEQGVKLALFGHTHLPAFYEYSPEEGLIADPDPMTGHWFNLMLDGRHYYLVNPGSVGQPRDGNPQAAFCLLDLEEKKGCISFHRVPYEIQACQEKMRREKFPDILINRLAIGY